MAISFHFTFHFKPISKKSTPRPRPDPFDIAVRHQRILCSNIRLSDPRCVEFIFSYLCLSNLLYNFTSSLDSRIFPPPPDPPILAQSISALYDTDSPLLPPTSHFILEPPVFGSRTISSFKVDFNLLDHGRPLSTLPYASRFIYPTLGASRPDSDPSYLPSGYCQISGLNFDPISRNTQPDLLLCNFPSTGFLHTSGGGRRARECPKSPPQRRPITNIRLSIRGWSSILATTCIFTRKLSKYNYHHPSILPNLATPCPVPIAAFSRPKGRDT